MYINGYNINKRLKKAFLLLIKRIKLEAKKYTNNIINVTIYIIYFTQVLNILSSNLLSFFISIIFLCDFFIQRSSRFINSVF